MSRICFYSYFRHDGEERLNRDISELRKELASRDETIGKLKNAISESGEVKTLN